MQMDPDYDEFVQKLRLLATFLLGALVGGAIVGLSSTDPQVSVNQQQSATTTAAPPTEPRRTTTTRRSTTTTTPREGTRDNPYPVGFTVIFERLGVDYWEIQVVNFDPDARAEVAAANQFNEPPDVGYQFALVTLRATYVGPDEPANLFELPIEAVDRGNVSYDFENSCGVIPDPIDTYAEIYRGGTITGNVCWEVRSEFIESLSLAVGASSPGSPPTFLALK